MRETGGGAIIDFPKKAIETAEVGGVGVENIIASAQIGYKGLFYFGDRFGFSGDRGRLCHVPAKYKNCEVLKLNDDYAVVIDPIDQSQKAVLRIPSDLWAKSEGKSYYSFLEGEDIWNIEGENLDKYAGAEWYGELSDFEYTDREERQSVRADVRDDSRREGIIESLKERGVITEKNGLRIWDRSLLKNIVIGASSALGEGYLRVSGKRKNTRDAIFALLRDEVGVLKEEYEEMMELPPKERKNLLPHEIFYLPNNLDEVFSPAMIRNRIHRIGYWEIGGRSQGGANNWDRVLELPSGESVHQNEMFLARTIYGDLRGYRDEDGVLNIYDEKAGQYKPISGQAMRRLTGRTLGIGGEGEMSLRAKPVEYVMKKCPELVSRGLLLEKDFKGNLDWRGDVGRQINSVNSIGYVAVGGHNFYVKNVIDPERTRDFGGVKLSDSEYAVVEKKPDGRQDVVATRKFTTEDYREGRVGSFHKYSIARENPQLPGESVEKYAERIRRMSDYGFVAKTVSEIAGQAETAIKEYLTWREQQWLATTLYARPDLKDAVIEATKNFGTDFLRTFLSCEYDAGNAEKILSLVEKLKTDEAERLFEKYGEIVQIVNDLESSLAEVTDREIEPEKRKEIRENILRRAKNLLVEFAEGKNDPTAGNILQKIESVQADAVIFGATFKTLFKENPKIDIKEMRGLDLQRVPLSWLSDKDKDEMVEIAKKNWLSREGGKDVVDKFESVLNGASKIDFYILRRDGKIISFMRFDEADSEGKRHAASFNVDPKYGGSAIGEMMVRTVLITETEKSVVDATVFPYQEKAPEYVEEIGFNITGVSHDKKTGLSELVLECDRRKNAQFASRGSSKETLMSLATSDGARNWQELIGHNVIVLKFNPTKERAILVGAVDGLVEAGYVGTRHFFDPKNKDERYYVFELDKTKHHTGDWPQMDTRRAVNE